MASTISAENQCSPLAAVPYCCEEFFQPNYWFVPSSPTTVPSTSMRSSILGFIIGVP